MEAILKCAFMKTKQGMTITFWFLCSKLCHAQQSVTGEKSNYSVCVSSNDLYNCSFSAAFEKQIVKLFYSNDEALQKKEFLVK